jgi:hypothetical protein
MRNGHAHTCQIKIAGRNHILPPLGIAWKTKHRQFPRGIKIEILFIPLLHAISHIFEISEDDHPLKIVGHARDH